MPDIHRCCESLLDTPSSADSGIKDTALDSYFNCPILEDHGFACMRYDHITPSVSGLFGFCGPYAIFRRIISIIVDPVYRVICRWSFSHIFEKVLKATWAKPSPTNINIATTIILVRTISWIRATLSHCIPYTMFWSPGFIMGGMPHPGGFTQEATATSRASLDKTIGNNLDSISAFAFTSPIGPCPSRHSPGNAIKHFQSSESYAMKIKFFDHAKPHIRFVLNLSKLIIRHGGGKVNV